MSKHYFALSKSSKKNKKYTITTPQGVKIHFGDDRYEDYTMHKNFRRKILYLARHKPGQNWNDVNTAGFWARWLLWNQKSLIDSLMDTEKRFGIKIKYDIPDEFLGLSF